MTYIDDKNLISQSINYCKMRTAILARIRNMKNTENSMYPETDYIYQSRLYQKQHPFTLFHALYWCIAPIFYYFFMKSKLLVFWQILYQPGLSIYRDLLNTLKQNVQLIKELALPFLLISLLYAVIIIVRNIMIRTKQRKISQQKLNELQQLVHDIGIAQRDLQELESKMRNPQNCIIPPKYWDAGEKIEEYLTNMRARNLTEAINLYESERHIYMMHQTQFVHCPRCGSPNVDSTTQVISKSNTTTIIIGLLLFLFLPCLGWIVGLIMIFSSTPSTQVITANNCKNCGYHF